MHPYCSSNLSTPPVHVHAALLLLLLLLAVMPDDSGFGCGFYLCPCSRLVLVFALLVSICTDEGGPP